MWQTNEVVKFDGKLYRILLVLPGEVVWICLESETAQPEYVHELTLNSFIDDSRLFRHDDPFEANYLDEPAFGLTLIHKLHPERNFSRFPGSDLPCDSQHGNDHANFCSSSCGRLG